MPAIDYTALLQQEFTEYSTRLRQKQEIDFDLAQREQFLRAKVNMLPEDQKEPWETLLAAISVGDVGLSDSIRNVLKSAPTQKFYTATEVKHMLIKSGFDFSKYTANPLSSVHAALKRLKPEEAEMNQIDGVMAWRWVKQPTELPIRHRKRKNTAKQARETTVSHAERTGQLEAAMRAIEERFGAGAILRRPNLEKKE
jgi:hypothetical protein